MEEVKSSNLHSVDYDPESRTLSVRFHSGRTYQYVNVDEEAYERLRSAESVGKHFNEYIKNSYALKR